MTKAALVHYWLVKWRGGEVVLDALGELLPDADLFAHVIDPAILRGSLLGRHTTETFIGRLPRARRLYKAYLPLMPLALEALDMSSYDIIVSSEAGPAKWVIPSPHARHICYCHSPMRYLWDQRQIYFAKLPRPFRPLAEAFASRMRRSDILSATRVDDFVANSDFVRQRIWKYYRREATVIYPPVDLQQFHVADSIGENYLVAGEIVPYKRVDLAVRACTKLDRRLRIVGGGDVTALKKIAGPTVEFVGRVSDEAFRDEIARCRALLFPGLEDFGLIPVETLASGRPVIAYGRGGVTETVQHGISGIFFGEQTSEALERAILEFEAEEASIRPEACVQRARAFSRQAFQTSMSALLHS